MVLESLSKLMKLQMLKSTDRAWCTLQSSGNPLMGFIFQHDKNPKHTANVVKAHLARKISHGSASPEPQNQYCGIILTQSRTKSDPSVFLYIVCFHIYLHVSVNYCIYFPFSQKNLKKYGETWDFCKELTFLQDPEIRRVLHDFSFSVPVHSRWRHPFHTTL